MYKFDYNFDSLWTFIHISLISSDESKSDVIINKIYNFIQSFESEFSRFKNDSILSILNKKKRLKVSPIFLDLLNYSKEIYKFTDWYFNPLIDIRQNWYIESFDKKIFRKIETDSNLAFEKIKIFWETVELEENMILDFWAIAKGFLADYIKNILIRKSYKDFIVNIWWDIVVNWENAQWKPWNIGIQDPLKNSEYLWTVELIDKSISTSWTYLRNWEIDWEKLSHIKSPKEIIEENSIISLSIVANNWYKSDALATWIFAMWEKLWEDFCIKNNIDFLMILNDWKKKISKDFQEKYNLTQSSIMMT